jgi:hypothetical protein
MIDEKLMKGLLALMGVYVVRDSEEAFVLEVNLHLVTRLQAHWVVLV